MPATAHRLGPGTLRLGDAGDATEFAAQATNVRLSPSVNEEDPIPVLSGEEIDGDDSIDWVLAGTLHQSYDREGLVRWCYDNRLQRFPFEFIPNNAESDYGWRGEVKVVPLEVGGDVKARNTSDFEFRCIGEPTPYDLDAGL